MKGRLLCLLAAFTMSAYPQAWSTFLILPAPSIGVRGIHDTKLYYQLLDTACADR